LYKIQGINATYMFILWGDLDDEDEKGYIGWLLHGKIKV